MKYGEILDFRTKDKAVVGKKYVYTNIFYKIANSPETCFIGVLAKVREDGGLPFLFQDDYNHQFIREIIEEEPKYRPYRDTDELKADFFKDCPEMDCPDMGRCYRPAIWVVSRCGSEFQIEGFSDEGEHVLIFGEYHSMKELLEDFKYLDGSPCGIKED